MQTTRHQFKWWYISLFVFSFFAILGAYFLWHTDEDYILAEQAQTVDDIIYTEATAFSFNQIDDNNCSVKLINKDKINVRIPATVTIDNKTYNVTEIASNGFASCSNLETVIMPHIVKINSTAFQNCKNLRIAYAPKVQEICMGAFMMCTKLTDFIFPSTLEKVESSIFLANNTKVHARFDSDRINWASNWNSGNSILNHDYNTRDLNGNLWRHDFIYEEISNSKSKAGSIKRIAPLQPFMETENQGALEIPSTETDIMIGAFCNATFDSITIKQGDSPINIWSSAFINLNILNGFNIDREVTYNCGLAEESVMPYNSLNTPYITLPTPEKLLEGMFINCTVDNINFKTDSGVIYEDCGTVKIPDSITTIKNNAFDGTKNIKHLYIPKPVSNIGISAFAQWDNTQTIHMPFLSELHATNVLSSAWKNNNSAKIEYVGEIKVISQPYDVRDNSTYSFVYEFKVNKNYFSIEDLTIQAFASYSGNNPFNIIDYEVKPTESLIGEYWVHRREYKFKIKPNTIGESKFKYILKIYNGNTQVMESQTKYITLHRYIQNKVQFNELYDLIDPQETEYDICLLNDIDLGNYNDTYLTWNRCIAGNNNYKFYGNNHTIKYNINIDKVPAKTSYKLGLFYNNNNTIKDLSIIASVNVRNFETVIENNTPQSGSVSVSGIATNNKESAIIENCNITINSYINAASSSGAGISINNTGTISNCTVSGKIDSGIGRDGVNLGGIATMNGFNKTAEIINCINNAELIGYGHIGGIVTQNAATVTKCKNNGKLTYKFATLNDNSITIRSTGGIIANNSGICSECTNTGTIKYGGNTSSSDNFIQPIMGQIIGKQSTTGSLKGNLWTGIVDTTGLSPNYGGGFNQTLYARNAEYGKLE